MDFALSTVDGFLSKVSREGQQETGVCAKAADGETADVSAAASASAASACDVPSENILKRCLRDLAGVASAAQRFPTGESYNIRCGGSAEARRGVASAGVLTLQTLGDVVRFQDKKHSSLALLRKVEEALSRLSISGSAESFDELAGHEELQTHLLSLVDESLEAVDAALSSHSQNPQALLCTRLPRLARPALEESPGKNKEPGNDDDASAPSASATGGTSSSSPRWTHLESKALRLCALHGPQMQWSHLIDNFAPFFVPRLVEKPHALEPLQPELLAAQATRRRRLEALRLLQESALTEESIQQARKKSSRGDSVYLRELERERENLKTQLAELLPEVEAEASAGPSVSVPHPYEPELNRLDFEGEEFRREELQPSAQSL